MISVSCLHYISIVWQDVAILMLVASLDVSISMTVSLAAPINGITPTYVTEISHTCNKYLLGVTNVNNTSLT